MSIESFIHAIPKVELNVRLEGAVRKETWLAIAEQNEIPQEQKQFRNWIQLLDNPDYTQLNELIRALLGWLKYPEDLTRLVYDLGVSLSKQNIKYAEVIIDLTLFMLPGLAFEELFEALNDGRDRVERGWGVQLGWILAIPRNQPRRVDEMLRWVASPTGKRGNAVAFGLMGQEDAPSIEPFERACNAAYKKEIPRVIQAGDASGAATILAVLQHLYPSRIVDGRGAAGAPEILQIMAERDVPLIASMGRALRHNWISSPQAYPLQQLLAANVKVILSADMPTLYQTTLSDEYWAAFQHCDLSLDKLEELALNAVSYSFLPDSDKAARLAEFKGAYEHLRAQHL